MRTSFIFCLLIVLASMVAGSSGVRADEFDSNGVKIHYVVAGKGEPVILVHGLYSSAKRGWELPGIMSELAKNFRVIALDCRGHGESGKPESDDEYGEKMAEDVVGLMDHLHIAKAHVVGYSMGGMIVMKLLTRHPERVMSAVLGGMGWLKTGSPLQRFWEMARPRENQKVPDACLRGLAKLAVTEAEVKAVRVPVTILVGDRDPCRRMYVEPLRKIRPDWGEHVIEGAGHMTCVTKPDFKAQVKSALGGRDSGLK